MDFVNKIFQEMISLSVVFCLFIYNISSKHDRETIINIQVDFYATHFTRITSAKGFGEFLDTTKFYLKICFTDCSSYIKR